MEHETLKKLIANNITFYRKRCGLTQIQLAEKINYSDKAVSKWERGESIPDVFVLNDLAEIFEINVADFTREDKSRKFLIIRRNKIVISIASVCIVWLVASIVFSWLRLLLPNFEKAHYSFIYAFPISAIVLLIFFSCWKLKIGVFVFYSALIWTLLWSIVISLPFDNGYWLFLIGVPLEVMGIVWLIGRKKKV